jgi:eukaryotic-like serine/threonine-protein kinase
MSLAGQQLGRYRFERLLGSGGMGEVYLATDTIINRQVAIKVIRAEVAPYPDANALREAARLFQREMKAIATLDHPHILALYDYGESRVNDATLTYMVMPYRSEGSLTSWLQRRGRTEPLSPQEVASLIDQAASALQHAHNRQVIHQDVKPANFLMQSDEENPSRLTLLLADFGVAKFSSATASASQAVRGTPSSMAPEQWEGHPVPASDQYALAVMAYELLAGRPPFQGGLSQVMFQHFNTPPPAPSTFKPRIPRAIDMVLLRALAKRPEERFPAISAFARAFQDAVQQTASSPIAGTPAPWTGPDIRATLAISIAESLSGTNRTLTLPGGWRVTVAVPAGAYNGQVIRLEGQAEPTTAGGPAGALILTLAVQGPEEAKELSNTRVAEKMARTSDPHLQESPIPPPPPGFQPLPPTVRASDPNFPPTIETAMPLAQEPGGRASDPDLGGTVASTPAPPPGIKPLPTPISPTPRSPHSIGKVILLAGLALLIIASGIGLFAVIHANQVATFNATATATAQAKSTTTAVAAQATGIAEANAVATQNAANATATVTVYQNLYNQSTSGTPALSDPLSDNSNGNRWSESTDNNGACQFTGGAYHVSTAQTNSFHICYASPSFSNFAYQVQMKSIKCDAGGVAFRANTTNNAFYLFDVGQDGSYQFLVCPPDPASCNSPLSQGSSVAIKQGLNQTNLLAVIVKGNTITLYVNQQEIDSVTDNTFSHGGIGLIANDISNPTEVVYNNAKVWSL